MISLNLNSPRQKKQIRLNRCYYLLKNSLGFIFIVLLAASVVLLLAKNDLQESFNTIVAEASLMNQQIRGSNQKITLINNQLSAISQIQEEFIPWSNLLVHLSKNMPPNIKMNFLIIQPEPGQTASQYNLTFKGLAKYRDDFLALKGQLEKMGLFERVEAPLGQLTKKENIEFEIKAAISLETIKASSQ